MQDPIPPDLDKERERILNEMKAPRPIVLEVVGKGVEIRASSSSGPVEIKYRG